VFNGEQTAKIRVGLEGLINPTANRLSTGKQVTKKPPLKDEGDLNVFTTEKSLL